MWGIKMGLKEWINSPKVMIDNKEYVCKEDFVNEFIRLTNQDKKDTDSLSEILGIEICQQRILSI